MSELRVGISGWAYGPWRKTFYPKGLAQRRELEFASRQVNALEINGSFYSLQKPESYKKWYDAVPIDFVFTVKAHRFVTHIKRLNDIELPLANFFSSGVLRLKEKLGAILWQFPPSMKYDHKRFEDFFKVLPVDTRAATKLGKKHEARMNGRTWFPPAKKNRPLRHAVEVRHTDFQNHEFIKLCRRYKIALVVAETAGKFPYFEEVTSNFMYVRLHGDVELYASGYDKKAIAKWAGKIRKLKKERLDVFTFFDNDIKVRAPYDAVALLKKLIPKYKTAEPMVTKDIATLTLPGPRLQKKKDPRWRGYGTKD